MSDTLAEWLDYRGLPPGTSLRELIEHERTTARLAAGFDFIREHDPEVRRYRLAWTSARQRAANHLLALVDSDEERDGLRAEVVRLGKALDVAIGDTNHYRRLYEQLTERVEEVRQSGIEAAEREL